VTSQRGVRGGVCGGRDGVLDHRDGAIRGTPDVTVSGLAVAEDVSVHEEIVENEIIVKNVNEFDDDDVFLFRESLVLLV